MLRSLHWLILLVLLGPVGISPARAELLPPQCVLIYNTNSRASRSLAEYYAHRRNIPADHLLGIALPQIDVLPRAMYDRDVVPRVRGFLDGVAWGESIRCLVTFYGVPLKIGAARSPHEHLVRARSVATRLSETQDQMEELKRVLESLADPDALPTPPMAASVKEKQRSRPDYTPNLIGEIDALRMRAAKRRVKLSGSKLRKFRKELKQAIAVGYGQAGLIQLYTLSPESQTPQQKAQREQDIRAAQELSREIRSKMGKDLMNPDRDDLYEQVEKHNGLLGLVQFLDGDLARLRSSETMAAFDSELTMLWHEGYDLYRWVPNAANPRLTQHKADRGIRLMLTARLDAPTPEIVRRMIDDAIRTEKRGLRGRVYVDDRGKGQGGPFALYQRTLRGLAELVESKTRLPVTYDNKPMVFQPGSCPEAALYCGWYSLRHYVDAFDFVPGAVGFHVASFELEELHNPSLPYWCPSMLEDGICATLGPVEEPYLSAFPSARNFFGLLLTGKYTLVECYFYTNRCNSWMMALLGDPLYNPFQANPQLRVEDILPPEALPLPDLGAWKTPE